MADSDVTFTAEERAYLDGKGEMPELKSEQPTNQAADNEPEIDFEDEPTAKEPEKSEEKPKLVPHQALHAERLKRQETERLLAEQRQQFARYEQRMNELNELLRPKEQIPDPVQDPIAALQYTQKQLEDMRQAQAQEQQQRQAYEREQALVQQVDTGYKQSWASKLNENPDAGNAYSAFVSALDGHFQLRGVMDPAQRQALIVQEERAIAYAAMKQGIDPAEAVIKQAALYGYRPQAQQPAPEDAAKTIENKQRGLAAAKSLSNAGGSTADNTLTPARIASMSTEEFTALKAKLSPAKFAKLMGAA